jgi:hypothetical protein
MKNSILTIALTTILAISGSVTAIAEEESSQTGRNGVKINLTGDFYHPNETQVLQKTTPVIEFFIIYLYLLLGDVVVNSLVRHLK